VLSVTKFDGSREPYSREKVVTTSRRMGASGHDAEHIADEVEKRLYDGMPTQEILEVVRRCLRECRPGLNLMVDLRKAISTLRPKPDFEHFIRMLLEEYGYDVTPNQIVRGRCVEHEIDAVARRGGDIVYVEVKHHANPHVYTGLDVVKEARATFEDLTEGHERGENGIGFNKTLVICNTKFSDHAKRYSACRGIDHVGWKSPANIGLEQRIEEKALYPITMFGGLSRENEEGLGNRGIILLKQVWLRDVKRLSRTSGVPMGSLAELAEFAVEVLGEKGGSRSVS